MAEVAHGAQHDFWRPPIQTALSEAVNHPEAVEACPRCETEFIVGSRYCHACGATRPGMKRSVAGVNSATLLQVGDLAGRLGLSFGSFIAFAVGILFVLFAAGIGVVYSARTVVDWQAVQLWRIEWLLAAVSAFLAGTLLKRDR
jgi:hypothetical protein